MAFPSSFFYYQYFLLSIFLYPWPPILATPLTLRHVTWFKQFEISENLKRMLFVPNLYLHEWVVTLQRVPFSLAEAVPFPVCIPLVFFLHVLCFQTLGGVYCAPSQDAMSLICMEIQLNTCNSDWNACSTVKEITSSVSPWKIQVSYIILQQSFT